MEGSTPGTPTRPVPQRANTAQPGSLAEKPDSNPVSPVSPRGRGGLFGQTVNRSMSFDKRIPISNSTPRTAGHKVTVCKKFEVDLQLLSMFSFSFLV